MIVDSSALIAGLDAKRMRQSMPKPWRRRTYGDCFVYSLAKSTGMPLLFKGEDFRHTDLSAVL